MSKKWTWSDLRSNAKAGYLRILGIQQRADAEFVGGPLLYIFREINDEQTFDFMTQIITGQIFPRVARFDLPKSRSLQKMRGGEQITAVFAYAVYAWNAWRKGKQLKYLRWDEGSDFPTAI